MTDTTPATTSTKPDPGDGVQLSVALLCAAAVILTVIGLAMAFAPADPVGYRVDAIAAAANALMRQENGRMLAVVGTILTMGTGIMLILRSRLAQTPGMPLRSRI